ncbi:unnamed protein product [Closterium sp. NIES-53]
MTNFRVLLHVAAQRDYELHSLDFSTAFLQGHLHEEIKLCLPRGITGNYWSLRRPVCGLRQAPREWHNTLHSFIVDLVLHLFHSVLRSCLCRQLGLCYTKHGCSG